MKKKMQSLILLLALMLLGFSAALRAEDTDIYVDGATNMGVPNLLFVIDNGANFSANAKIGCSVYTGTTEAPSLGTSTAAGVEQCALVDALNALADGSINIGILVSNGNNFATDVRAAGDNAYHETCSTDTGGCLIRKLMVMNAANKASLIKFIKSWKLSGQNSATEFNIKVNTAFPGTMMQEAWAYLNGKVGMSGTSYSPSLLGTGCQKNFIVYIANAEKTPANESPSPYDGTNALTSAQASATADQKIKLSNTVKFDPAACGATSAVATTANGNWSENWADEWSRLMFQQDGGATAAEGKQNIISYTVGILNNDTCTPDYPALLSNMAAYGGGKFFPTSSVSDVTTALQKILNEVQAVNSVFSSASLPVSVNAEGTFLNQIFLGMFRPDSSGAPRWQGNLKQYQLVKNSSGALIMGDAQGNAAISSAGTGFISPNAVSYWTKKMTSTAPDDAGGFFVNDKKGVPENGYDSPDGEVVEKGGVSQQLRLESLTADFGATAGGSSNPRRLYTYCPSGTCTFALTDSSNEFSIANAGIGAAAFGGSSTLPVKSIVRSGTSATVTTTGNHGFTTGATVTISNAGQAEYNVTQAVTVTSSTTFTISGLPDYPVTPSAGTYTVAPAAGSTVSITSISRSSSTTGSKNSETVTVTTSAPHVFTTGSNIAISGATPSVYNYSGLPATVDTNSFTFPIAIEPNTSAVNIYQAQLSPTVYTAISNVSLTNPATGSISGSTSAAHRLHVGQTVTISVPNDTNSKYAGTYTIATTATSTTFTITNAGTNVKNLTGVTATVTPDTSSVKTISVLSREATTASATATATGLPANFFGANTGDTKILNITKLSGSQANESAYVSSGVTITCANTGCTSFTYPITVTPAIDASGSMTVGLAGAGSASLAAGAITRSGTTATVSGVTANLFTNGQPVNISASGAGLSSESAYLGTWTISCTAPCTSFTFGPVTLSPSTPATGSNITAYSGSTPPDRDTIIKWIRGADNYGDEKGPGGSVTVRPSVHGDVLHSRPLVVNYGDSRGIVVFYGSNDGIYRAVNGNQTAAIGDVPAGGEVWGLILPEHYNQITRLRLNSPELKFPATTLATAQPKDYFVDGPTGAYQKLTSSGTIDKAYLYLTMRRGGRFMYALDVSQPTTPTVSWTISSGMTGFEELGQTWSRPRVTVLQREVTSTGTPTPYLIFGAGYDTAQDSEPPGTDSKGRGIFIVNATTGALVWSANPTCTTSATCRNVPSMTYAIPSDIAFVDRDGNGYTDKLYFPDLGGNIWRADVSDQDSANWTVTKVAALGCATGDCASGTTPRKFFFPPSVLSIKPAGAAGSYDALSIASGDREHPLKSSATGASYGVNDRFFMIMDRGTTVGGTATSGITPSTLFNATSATYDGSLNGFYINFATGEKAVNAPLAVNGTVFFGTNRPIDPLNTCAANLGEAKAYGVSPFLGTQTSNILPGGGLAPSAVSGLITIETTDSDGNKTSSEEKFCIGCGVGDPEKGGSCNSALENCLDEKAIAKNLRRTYWYKK